jgi:hypothetical protein
MSNDKEFGAHRLTSCRICDGEDLIEYLDLGNQPPSNSFIGPEQVTNEHSFPLKVALCRNCGLSQLLDVVNAADIFADYLYLASTSKALCDHYAGLVDAALNRFRHADGSLMVDIGCNDGIMLKGYPPDRFRLLGIEPSSAGDYAREAGFEVVPEFFDHVMGERLAASHGPASIITATNVFAHVDDIRSFAAGVRALLADDGVYISEFPYLDDMLEKCYFDTIYHEHLSYLALTPLTRLFADTGLRAFRVERMDVGASGPALRLFVCRDDSPHETDSTISELLAGEESWGVAELARYQEFAARVAAVREELLDWIAELRDQGHRIGAYCAPAKGNTLLNYLGLTVDDIVAVSDNNDLKVGKLTPGTHIPIVSDKDFLDSGVSHALLLAWNYADFFVANAEFVKRGGQFIVPLPAPVIRP